MHTATAKAERATPMNPPHNSLKAGFWGTIAIGLTGAAPVNADVFTPQALAALIGSTAALLMAATSLLNAARPYMERYMDARRQRKCTRSDPVE